ncbi:uncharacterized protein LOC143510735 [Brachyhypopomus gauderio]|uniref:uncharacterized protein LOC143510735 n=1 Tax=Brachyhypopomus gauderio TaxID=698409 RepID=UPI004040FBE6
MNVINNILKKVLSPSNGLNYSVVVIGNTKNCHKAILKRLTQSVNLREVKRTASDCDVVIAFVSIVSRAGTDIEAALQDIPDNRPVVLVALHHTFDPYFIAPNSSAHVRSRPNVFAVDCLFHEDLGLLTCPHNDIVLARVQHHLMKMCEPAQVSPFWTICKWAIFGFCGCFTIFTVKYIWKNWPMHSEKNLTSLKY